MFNFNDKNEVNLSEHELQKFQKDGVIAIKNFYSLTSEILPIQKDIYRIIGLIIVEHCFPIKQEPFTFEFHTSN